MESMIKETAVHQFLTAAIEETDESARSMDLAALEQAADLIQAAETKGGRLHVTGIGKPGHVAGYIASLFSSTGTPTYFLHGTEAVHGSCGQLKAGDVVICISNSGETSEMKATAAAIRANGCQLIAVTGRPDSWLARQGEVHLFAGVREEGGPLNRAPRASVLAEMLVLQALSVVLQERKGLTPSEYVLRHPGGSLGALRENER